MTTARKKKDEVDFEASLKRLEEIVRRLEDEQAPLEESLGLFAEGKKLAKSCESQLRQAENRVKLLIEDAEGKLGEAELDEEKGEPSAESAGRTPDAEPEKDKDKEKEKEKDDLPF